MNPLVPNSWPEETLFFGLMIQVTDPQRRQLHTGALYRLEGRLMIGDLASHCYTRRLEVRASESIYWIDLDLSHEEQRILAAQIDAWLTINHNKIPYSVAHPGGVVFKNNVWVGKQPGQGLTCATFIMELFNELGIPLLDINTWEQRPGDKEWAEIILSCLTGSMSKEHVDAQMDNLGQTVRVRPADIVAAGALIHQEMEDPLQFKDVSPPSACIEEFLLSCCQ